MYAPFGTGALVGRRDIFLEGVPEYQGGGTVEIVTPTDVRWAGLPDREEAGTPNVVGAVAMAAAARVLMAADMNDLRRHETSLTTYALERLQSLPGVTIYGAKDPGQCVDRVGVIPFNLEDQPHALVAAILGYEGGIGVRSGCFCAQSYVAHLLGFAEAEPDHWRARLAADTSPRPGMVRISLGAYNSSEDVDVLVEVLGRILRNDYRGQYYYAPESSDYRPVGYQDSVHRFAVQPTAEAIV
jgi:selenocysteine lyase/cysteine desulfurase